MPAGHPTIVKRPGGPGGPTLPVKPKEVCDEEKAHGPNSHAHHINWYQGLAGVDNKKALSESFLDRLLWRYYNKDNACDEKNMEPPFIAAFLNIAIVIGILFAAGRKPIGEALSKRKKTIMADIDAATELKVAAEKRLKSYQKQLSRIEVRRNELQEEYRVQWESERKRILAEAEEKATRLRKDAEFRVAQEMKQAQQDLLREAVDGAVTAAEELVKKRIAASDQERLAGDYLAFMGEALGGARSDRRSS